jgi:hypothetical protein
MPLGAAASVAAVGCWFKSSPEELPARIVLWDVNWTLLK